MRRSLLAVGVVAALFGCREKSSEGPELFAPVASARAPGQVEVAERPRDNGVKVEESAPPPAPHPSPSTELTTGITREALMDALGDCARRIAFVPTDGKGRLTVEVFQPKAGPCVEKFKARRFTVTGGIVSAVEEGLDTAADAPAPVPLTVLEGK